MSSAIANTLLGLICIGSSGLRTPELLMKYYLGRRKHKSSP
jgi:hypothetical protein